MEKNSMMEKSSMMDILVPTYQNEDLTIACFESIKRCTAKGTYRIIWIDSGSTVASREKVIKVITEEKRKYVGNIVDIFLFRNIGYVGAINEGMKISNAPTVCLLNNDTIVSKGWLDKLTAILYSDKNIGIVGPLTENTDQREIDSGQNIVHQKTLRKLPIFTELEQFNIELEEMYKGVAVEPVGFLTFSCIVIKREVIDKITASDERYAHGGLDFAYGFGTWDDADYCYRAKELGYSSKLALDTCIYHRGRSTFKLLKEEGFDVDGLLTRNRRYLDKIRFKEKIN